MTRPAPHWPSALLVVLGAIVLALPWIHGGWAADDEYAILCNGKRAFLGEVPYRDYFYVDMPLDHLLPAFWYWVSGGPSVVVARCYELAALVLVAWQTHRLGRWLGAGPWIAVLPAWMILGCFFPRVTGVNHHWIVQPFLFAGLLAGMRAITGGSPRWWALAGAASALACLCLQTDGLVVTVALGLAASLGGWLAGEAPRESARRLGAFLAGWAAPVAVTLAGLAGLGALHAFYQCVVVWPSTHVLTGLGGGDDVRFLTDLPDEILRLGDTRFARPVWYLRLVVYLATTLVPVGVALVALAWGLGLLRERLAGRTVDVATRRLGLVAIACVGLAFEAMHGKADVHHFGCIATPAFVLVAVAASRALAAARGPWQPVAALPVLLFGLVLAGGQTIAASALTFRPVDLWTLGGPEARVREDAVVSYLRAHARPADRMVAFPAGPYYYYYGPRPGTRVATIMSYRSGFPGKEQLDGFWRDVRGGGARWLVFDPTTSPKNNEDWHGPPPGYKLVFRAPSRRYEGPWVEVYERQP